MKTITEFSSIYLKTAAESEQTLSASGKSAEELPAALGEALKIEGDKLKFLLHALTLYRARGKGMKRVLVMTASEGEKIPAGVEKSEEHYYIAEFFPTAAGAAKQPESRDSKGRSGGKRGDRKGGERSGRGRPQSDSQRPAAVATDRPSRPAAIVINPPRADAKEAGGRRPPRAPRAPRPPRAPGTPRASRSDRPAVPGLDNQRAPRALRIIPRAEVEARKQATPEVASASAPVSASSAEAQ